MNQEGVKIGGGMYFLVLAAFDNKKSHPAECDFFSS